MTVLNANGKIYREINGATQEGSSDFHKKALTHIYK